MIFGYGIPIGTVLLIALAAVICIGIALAFPKHLMFGYVAILMSFPQSSSYGLLDGEITSVIYVKGTKTFFFSFLDMFIFGTWLMAVVFGRLWQRERREPIPLTKYYLAFGALFLGHVLVGLMEPKHFSLLDFSGRGVINIFWQGMFVSLLVATIRTERDLKILLWIVLACTAGRETFGFVRFLFFGGDPQNAYANLEHLKIKITFFDINDSIIACFVVAFCSWKLLADKVRGWHGIFYAGLGGMAVLTPLLSGRRTGQIGLILAAGLLTLLLPRGRRWPIVLSLILIVPAAALIASQRSQVRDASFVQKLLLDVKITAAGDPRRTRFHEFVTAWSTVRENPWFGVGPTGEFRVTDPVGLEYHQGRYDFIHSGFGHVFLKMGLVGLFIFMGIFVAYQRFLLGRWHSVPAEWRPLMVAGACAFVAQVPGLLFGTPIGEIRTMQILGLTLAIPFMVLWCAKAESPVAPHTSATARPLRGLAPLRA